MIGEQVREAFGKALVEAAREDERIVVLDADLATSTKVVYFGEEFPNRYFQMGVAEQNMVGAAAGLALMGKIPFVSSFAVFLTKRACDQVSASIAYPRLNVKLIGAYSGIVSGNNGATHQAIEDVAIMRSMPGFVLLDPADDVEMKAAVRAAIAHDGPVYLRVTRDAWPRVCPEDHEFEIGKAATLRDGRDITLIGAGVMTSQCLEAAEILSQDRIDARVINMSSIKPIDAEAIVRAARQTGAIVTAENHTVYGGLGSAVAEVLVENFPVPMLRVGLKDTFGECGTNEELLKKYGLAPQDIATAARKVLRRKPGWGMGVFLPIGWP